MDFNPEELLRLARIGAGQALGELLEHYRNYLTLLARTQLRRRVRGKVEAADLVQETFLSAHRDFSSFQGATEASLVSWLRTVLSARLIDIVYRYYGSQKRNVMLEREIAEDLERSSRAFAPGLVSRQSSPSRQAVRRERAVLLADALRALPADYEEVIVLRNLEGLTFAEVARKMGRTLDSVEKLWVRALGRLRTALEGLA